MLPADEGSWLHRQVSLVQAFQRREFAVAELVDPLRRGQIPQAMLA